MGASVHLEKSNMAGLIWAPSPPAPYLGGALRVLPILREGELPNLWHPVQNENTRPLFKKQENSFLLFPTVSQPVIVFYMCYLMLHFLGPGDTCGVSADPHGHRVATPKLGVWVTCTCLPRPGSASRGGAVALDFTYRTPIQ